MIYATAVSPRLRGRRCRCLCLEERLSSIHGRRRPHRCIVLRSSNPRPRPPGLLPQHSHQRATHRRSHHVHPYRFPATHCRQLPPKLLPILRHRQTSSLTRSPTHHPAKPTSLQRAGFRQSAIHWPPARLASVRADPLVIEFPCGG